MAIVLRYWIDVIGSFLAVRSFFKHIHHTISTISIPESELFHFDAIPL